MSNYNSVVTPLPTRTVLKVDKNEPEIDYKNTMLYRIIVRSTIYLLNYTRPDISYPVGQLARFIAKPKLLPFRLSKHLLQYLQKTLKHSIVFGSDSELNTFTVYADAI
jgi:hypothetical protein